MRTSEGEKVRGATPKLTAVKHELPDWVEMRIKELSRDGDEHNLARTLNSELHAAGLNCNWENPSERCPEWIYLGYVSDIQLRRSGDFLILITGVGIECGFDDSAYLYGWSPEGWRRVWQNEQNEYTEDKYLPQSLVAVEVSSYSPANDYLVMTLGRQPWCQSNWHDVYYRIFRPGGEPEATPCWLTEGTMRSWGAFGPLPER